MVSPKSITTSGTLDSPASLLLILPAALTFGPIAPKMAWFAFTGSLPQGTDSRRLPSTNGTQIFRALLRTMTFSWPIERADQKTARFASIRSCLWEQVSRRHSTNPIIAVGKDDQDGSATTTSGSN